MGHHQHHQHQKDGENTKALRIAFWLNLSFSIIEIVGGVFTNSMAILSDAVHDLGDSITIGGALYFQKVSERRRDKHFSYGYKRFSTLSALLTFAILVISSIWIVVNSIPRILNPQEVNSEGMLVLALIGITFNGLAVFKMQGKDSLNTRAVRLHLLEDVLGWIAVLIGGIVIYFTNLFIIDPILSLIIATYIAFNALKNIKSVSKIFLQGIPEDIDMAKVKADIKELNDVFDLHDLHSWSMDGEFNILTIHVVISEECDRARAVEIKSEVRHILSHNNIQHVTIEIETAAEKCELEDC